MASDRIGWEEIGAVVLDAVGTLIDPSPPVAEAYAAAARRQGIEVDPEVVRRRFKAHFRRDEQDDLRGPMVTDEAIEYRRWRRIVGEVLPDLPDPERAFLELWEHFGRPDAWQPFDDVGPVLHRFREAGLAIRVGSNFDGRLRSVLAGLPGLSDLAASAVISSEVGYRKPHPSFFQTLCARLDLPPERILLIGDDLENDVNGARTAGLRAALVDRSGRRSKHPAFPDLLALADWLDGPSPGQEGPDRGGAS